MITEENIENWFTHHPRTAEQRGHHAALHDCVRNTAMAILNHTPPCAEQTLAIRKLQESMMWADTAIACTPAKIIEGLEFTADQKANVVRFSAHYHGRLNFVEVTKQQLLSGRTPIDAIRELFDDVATRMEWRVEDVVATFKHCAKEFASEYATPFDPAEPTR